MKISQTEIQAASRFLQNADEYTVRLALHAAYSIRRIRKTAKRERQRKALVDNDEIGEFKPCVVQYEEARITEIVLEDCFTVWVPHEGLELGYNNEGNLIAVKVYGLVAQRKEKNKQVVESVKPASVAAFLKDGETVLDRLQRGQRDEVMLMKLLAEEKLKNEALTKMNADQIKHMTERFLGWKLPENFHPDGGITFKATFNENTPHPMKAEPVGTNLFDYSQAKAMVEYMIEGLPISSATPSKAPEWDGNASAFDAAMKPKA